MTDAEVRPQWLVVDIRAASSENHSGLARFVIGLSRALGEALSVRRSSNDFLTKNVKVLLVSKSEPPRWAIELVQRYPSVVSFWSGGPGALGQSWEKPQYFWSSIVLHRMVKWSEGQFYWIAPCNFDRPLFTSILLPRALRSRIVQVVHDTIPLDQARSMSFLFRTQFSLIVRRTLSKFPHVFTVSDDSAQRLARLAPRRNQIVTVIPSGIEPIFGSSPRHSSAAALLSARRSFLDILFAGGEGYSDAAGVVERPQGDELDDLVRRRWVIGVGRSQKYKGWELAENVVGQLQSDLSEGVVFFRIGGDADGNGAGKFARPQQNPKTHSDSSFTSGFRISRSESKSILRIESLPDEMLAQLYRCADVLVHPSQAEGFGFPPVEAALSGLPVIFRTGTAVGNHFSGHSFHPSFWQGLPSDDVDHWREAVLAVLRNKNGLDSFKSEMASASDLRAFICTRGGGHKFTWLDAAEQLLSTLFVPVQVKPPMEVAE